MARYVTSQRGCIIGAVRSLLPELTYPWWYTGLPVVHLLHGISKGLPHQGYQQQGINLFLIFMMLRVRHSPPTTGGTNMCLSVVLLVNKFHYWLEQSKKQRML